MYYVYVIRNFCDTDGRWWKIISWSGKALYIFSPLATPSKKQIFSVCFCSKQGNRLASDIRHRTHQSQRSTWQLVRARRLMSCRLLLHELVHEQTRDVLTALSNSQCQRFSPIYSLCAFAISTPKEQTLGDISPSSRANSCCINWFLWKPSTLRARARREFAESSPRENHLQNVARARANRFSCQHFFVNSSWHLQFLLKTFLSCFENPLLPMQSFAINCKSTRKSV